MNESDHGKLKQPKRERLHQWLLERDDWVFLREIPADQFGMTKQTCQSALRSFVEIGRVESRVHKLNEFFQAKQYRALNVPAQPRGKRPSRRIALWRETLELIAAPPQPDGAWDRDRRTCQKLAEKALRLD